ncbi:hypothetical protein [Caldilinea sp.]|uniref:hypothetical protein n=1 Tax=Caldilinea sp. TaxID=2293560 RepID=UPI0025877693|nr:hypothetical protein [Caldilinea sp.]
MNTQFKERFVQEAMMMDMVDEAPIMARYLIDQPGISSRRLRGLKASLTNTFFEQYFASKFMVYPPFTYAYYRALLEALIHYGYHFVSFGEVDVERNDQVVLRHDVDLSLEAACALAEIEAECDVHSVYHVLLTADVYNPASRRSQALLARIRALGHRIGLHIDPAALPKDPVAMQERLAHLFHYANEILGPLDSYSMHRPVANGEMEYLKPQRLPFPTPPYADDDRYRNHLVYRSDSRREWRHGDLLTELKTLRSYSLHINLHPIWWTEQAVSREEALKRFLFSQHIAAEQYLCDNLSFYRAAIVAQAGS